MFLIPSGLLPKRVERSIQLLFWGVGSHTCRNSTTCRVKIVEWRAIKNRLSCAPRIESCWSCCFGENDWQCSRWAFASKLYPTTKLRLDSKLNQIMKNSKGIILKWATFPSAVKTEYFSTPVLSLPLPTLESLKKQCRGTGENPSHNCCEEFLASL